MRYISLLLLVVALLTANLGCKTNTVLPAPPTPTNRVAFAISTNQVLTMLEGSVRLNTFNVVRTNQTIRSGFQFAIDRINDQITAQYCNPTTLRYAISNQSTIVLSNIDPALNLLEYYTKNHTNIIDGIQGLTAIKTGIEKGLGK